MCSESVGGLACSYQVHITPRDQQIAARDTELALASALLSLAPGILQMPEVYPSSERNVRNLQSMAKYIETWAGWKP